MTTRWRCRLPDQELQASDRYVFFGTAGDPVRHGGDLVIGAERVSLSSTALDKDYSMEALRAPVLAERRGTRAIYCVADFRSAISADTASAIVQGGTGLRKCVMWRWRSGMTSMSYPVQKTTGMSRFINSSMIANENFPCKCTSTIAASSAFTDLAKSRARSIFPNGPKTFAPRLTSSLRRSKQGSNRLQRSELARGTDHRVDPRRLP